MALYLLYLFMVIYSSSDSDTIDLNLLEMSLTFLNYSKVLLNGTSKKNKYCLQVLKIINIKQNPKIIFGKYKKVHKKVQNKYQKIKKLLHKK